jgi:hypothetical protein
MSRIVNEHYAVFKNSIHGTDLRKELLQKEFNPRKIERFTIL